MPSKGLTKPGKGDPRAYLAVRRSHNFRPSVMALLRKRLYDSRACVQNGDPCNKRKRGKNHIKRKVWNNNKRKSRILNGETLIKLLKTNMDTMRTSTPTENNKVQMFIVLKKAFN